MSSSYSLGIYVIQTKNYLQIKYMKLSMKKEDKPTIYSKRYIGNLDYKEENFLIYAVHDGKIEY